MQENVTEIMNPKELNKINKSGSNTSSNAFSNPDRYGSEKWSNRSIETAAGKLKTLFV